MKDTMLKRLYSGEIYPAEDIGRHPSPEERQRNQRIEQEREHLRSLLSAADWVRFEKLESLQMDSAAHYGFESFTFGFRLGALMMMEALLPDNN